MYSENISKTFIENDGRRQGDVGVAVKLLYKLRK